jgi:hypothetical protein
MTNRSGVVKMVRLLAVGAAAGFLLGCNLLAAANPPLEAIPAQPSVPATAPARGLESGSTPESTGIPVTASGRLQPTDFTYLGAFRLPGDEERPRSFDYGGNAMTFNPDGDTGGGADGYPGSLFITGHDRIPFGELPDGDQVAEVSIPAPVTGKSLEAMNTAEFVQGFHNVAVSSFKDMDEIPKVGMAYLNRRETGPLIHMSWGAHLQPQDKASHAWFSTDLANPNVQGYWFIGDQDLYSVNGYMFEIPEDWADAHTGGKPLGTGRMRDGGQGGMGPELFAYQPWNADGSPAADGTHLPEVPLIQYEKSSNTEEFVRCMQGYQHADEWEGGAWLTTKSGKAAVLFAGTKATGAKTWYGYVNPDGPERVCVDPGVTDNPTCRLADGGLCPQSDMSGCCGEGDGECISMRGWWSNRFDAQLILYDPADLAKVASGEIEAWQPQPYTVIDIDEHLLLSPPEWEIQMVGSGEQRRYRIGDVAFDRANGLLYVLEQYADGARPLVHVWRVE